jgi:hypothetical protein
LNTSWVWVVEGIDGLKPSVRELTYHPVPDIA